MEPAGPIVSLSVGRYRLEVGGTAGTLIAHSRAPPEGDVAPLAQALEQKRPVTPGESIQEIVDSADDVTTAVEEAVALFKDLASGRIAPRDASARVDLMLDMLERLDSQGRWEEARRLARALNGVLALLFRWADLVRSLKVVRAHAEGLGDIGWSEHELGTLHLVAGDPAGANRRLEEAERIRRELRHEAELAATQHNLRVLCRELRDQLDSQGGPPAGRQLLLLCAAAVTLLLIGGVAGAALSDDDGVDDDGVQPASARLAVQREGAGSVTSVPAGISCPDRCQRSFPRDSVIVLAARPNTADAPFAGWRGGGCQGTGGCKLTLSGDRTVTATFKAAEADTATLGIDPPVNGTVTSDTGGIACPQACEATLVRGTPVTLTAVANKGFLFGGWGEDCTGSGPCNVTLDADRRVTASFVAPVTVTVSVVGDGTVTSAPGGIDCPAGNCSASIGAGQRIVLTAAGDFRFWGAECEEGTMTTTCTLTPAGNTDVRAVFADVD
jgi:hypothetical protein